MDTLKVENAYATSLECHMKEGPLFFLFQSTIKITVIMMLTNKSILLDLIFSKEKKNMQAVLHVNRVRGHHVLSSRGLFFTFCAKGKVHHGLYQVLVSGCQLNS